MLDNFSLDHPLWCTSCTHRFSNDVCQWLPHFFEKFPTEQTFQNMLVTCHNHLQLKSTIKNIRSPQVQMWIETLGKRKYIQYAIQSHSCFVLRSKEDGIHHNYYSIVIIFILKEPVRLCGNITSCEGWTCLGNFSATQDDFSTSCKILYQPGTNNKSCCKDMVFANFKFWLQNKL